ncbi:MAG: MarR family transcriptional regulator [Actinophytocola sp.]|uniref:MarR family winged helix-turn-helix transcriptional regulator n=1 Tax=Actinophytocola sp. TaxID=1872138 RepID=UPI00132961BC|nr:MarR family winged helix-turn-helix transcriptional regulator [Actinophytocola sp.]MPZ84322.1 MarR family transcriptional regulator [Actinophytocola sp.]
MTDVEAYRLLIADVYELAGTSRRTSEKLAGEAGQTAARWHVLSVLSDGPRTVPGAARRLGLAPQSVQRVVADLLASGHVEATPNPDHVRSPLIGLTEDGRETVGDLFARSEHSRAAVLERAGVSGKRLRQAREAIRALVDALRGDDPTPLSRVESRPR